MGTKIENVENFYENLLKLKLIPFGKRKRKQKIYN